MSEHDDLRRELAWLEKYFMAELRALSTKVEVQITASATALAIADREYKRRDDELNHAHARAAEAAQLTVPREVYQAGRDDEALRREDLARQFQAFKEANVKALTDLREEVTADVQFKAGEAKANARTISVFVSAGISLVFLLLSWFLKGGAP